MTEQGRGVGQTAGSTYERSSSMQLNMRHTPAAAMNVSRAWCKLLGWISELTASTNGQMRRGSCISGRKASTRIAAMACVNRKRDVTIERSPAVRGCQQGASPADVRGDIVNASSRADTQAIASLAPVSSGAGRTSHALW